MTEHIKYPKIGQFRNALKAMSKCNITEIELIGTVKLHGTNAAVVFDKGDIYFQSRNRVLTPEDDNAGFVAAMTSGGFLQKSLDRTTVVYGEWCGGNIQKGVGICELPKTFVIFDITVDGAYLSVDEVAVFGTEGGIVDNIYNYKTFEHTLNSNTQLESQATLSKLTLEVEEECPVAKARGVSGIGEGIVWKPADPLLRQNTDLCFKTKGSKHSKSKVKTIAAPTPERIAKDNAIAGFIEYAVTQERLDQGIANLEEMGMELDRTSTGAYLSYVINDIWEEELDVIEENRITRKDLNGRMSKSIRVWYFNKVD